MDKPLSMYHRDNAAWSNAPHWVRHAARKRWFVFGAVVLSFLFIRSMHRTNGPPESTVAPTPYRIDLASWPSRPDSGQSAFAGFSFSRTGDDDLKPVSAVLYRVSEDLQDTINNAHNLLRYPFIREILIHSPMHASPLDIEVCLLSCWRDR